MLDLDAKCGSGEHKEEGDIRLMFAYRFIQTLPFVNMWVRSYFLLPLNEVVNSAMFKQCSIAPLGRNPIESVDILCTCVAEQQWRVIGRE